MARTMATYRAKQARMRAERHKRKRNISTRKFSTKKMVVTRKTVSKKKRSAIFRTPAKKSSSKKMGLMRKKSRNRTISSRRDVNMSDDASSSTDKVDLLQMLKKILGQKKISSLDQENIRGKTPLIIAIKRGDYELAMKLIRLGFYQPKRVDTYSELTPLHYCSAHTDERFLKFMVKTFKHFVNSKDYKGNTPLHYACYERNYKFTEILIENGGKPNLTNFEGNTPIHFSCLSYNPNEDHPVKLEEFLLTEGANVNAKNKKGMTPLMYLFQEREEDPEVESNASSHSGRNSEEFDPIAAMTTLIKHGADVTLASKKGKTALHIACIKGATSSALMLINGGANCEDKDIFGITPFGYALKNNYKDLCIFLIQQDKGLEIPVNQVIHNESHICHQLNYYEDTLNSRKIQDLFERKEELDEMDAMSQIKEGYMKLLPESPFHYAIKNNMQGNIYLLLHKGLDLYSALCQSIIHNKYNFFISVCESLDTKGLSKKKTVEGKNLLHVLAEHYADTVEEEVFDEVFDHMNSLKIDENARDNEGRLPLHYAFENGNISIIQRFLDGKSKKEKIDLCNTEDDEGVTAFSMLYHHIYENSDVTSPITEEIVEYFEDIFDKIKIYNKYEKKNFPYYFFSYVLEDGDFFHPLLLLLRNDSETNNFDSIVEE